MPPPLPPRSASSTASSSTATPAATDRPSRARYTYHLSAPSSSYQSDYHLLDVDALDKSTSDCEYRRQKLPGYENSQQRSVISQGFQAQAQQATQAAQTTPALSRNASVQTRAQTLEESQCREIEATAAFLAFVDRSSPLMLSELNKNLVLDLFKDDLQVTGEEEEEDAVNDTKTGTAPPTGVAVSQPAASKSIATSGISPSSHAMSLFHSFHHLTLSKQHTVHHVEWHPQKACVAFSLTPAWSFDQWAEHSGEVSLSYIMLYDLGSLLHPYCIIKVPGLVTCFKFHPHQPAYLVAGLQTGQCILYQITNQREQHKHALLHSVADIKSKPSSSPERKELPSSTTASSSSFLSSLTSFSGDKSASSLLPSPLYALLSNLDRSHGRPVTTIHWLPPSQQLNRKGELLTTHNHARPSSGQNSRIHNTTHVISTQFVTLAGDGRFLYWDFIQLNELSTTSAQNYANNHTTAASSFTNTGSLDDGLFFNNHQHEQRDGKWSPTFCLPLNPQAAANATSSQAAETDVECTDGEDRESSLIAMTNSHLRVSMSYPVSTGITARKVAPGPPTGSWAAFTVLTEDGEILDIDSNTRPPVLGRRCRVHASVGNSLERSSLIPTLFLSCGDTTWALWNHVSSEELNAPIFISPPCSIGTYSCARFSPTRAAVLALARSDGVVEIWDCLDASHAPSYHFAIGTADRITDLSFPSTNAKEHAAVGLQLPFLSPYSTRQYLAAGDSSGKCHIVEMPRPLRRRVPNEEAHMNTFITREAIRGRFVQTRELLKRSGKALITPCQEQAIQMANRPFVHILSDHDAENAYDVLCKELQVGS